MSGKKSMIAIALLLAISILALLFVSGNIHMESEQKDALKIKEQIREQKNYIIFQQNS